MGDMSDAEAMERLERLRKDVEAVLKMSIARRRKSSMEAAIADIQALDIALGCLLRRRKDKGV